MSFLKFAERNPDAAQRILEARGNKISALRRRGICVHGWVKCPPGQQAVTCLDCGAVFADSRAHFRASREAMES